LIFWVFFTGAVNGMLRSGGVDKSTVQSEEVWTGKLLSLGPFCNFITVLGIRIRRIRIYLGLPDPDPLVRGKGSRFFPFLIKVLSGLK
jgi:hypothetical protein